MPRWSAVSERSSQRMRRCCRCTRGRQLIDAFCGCGVVAPSDMQARHRDRSRRRKRDAVEVKVAHSWARKRSERQRKAAQGSRNMAAKGSERQCNRSARQRKAVETQRKAALTGGGRPERVGHRERRGRAAAPKRWSTRSNLPTCHLFCRAFYFLFCARERDSALDVCAVCCVLCVCCMCRGWCPAVRAGMHTANTSCRGQNRCKAEIARGRVDRGGNARSCSEARTSGARGLCRTERTAHPIRLERTALLVSKIRNLIQSGRMAAGLIACLPRSARVGVAASTPIMPQTMTPTCPETSGEADRIPEALVHTGTQHSRTTCRRHTHTDTAEITHICNIVHKRIPEALVGTTKETTCRWIRQG